jgi:CheY-like chemotaxis protein
LSLPDGNGIELLTRLSSRFARLGASGQLPAIAMSGSVYDEDVARSLEAGFAAHLAKPFDEEGLMKAVQQVTQMLGS